MAYFAVSYQLNKKKDYQPLWDALGNLGAHRVMRSFWFVDCDTTVTGLRDHLLQFIDDDDSICIVPFSQRPAHRKAFLGTNDWIGSRF